MSGGTREARRLLPAQPSSVPVARRTLRAWLTDAGAADLAEPAELAVSEVVTNALVHAGTPVELRARIDLGFVRVEVADGSTHLPRRREVDSASGTGRGLVLLEQSVDRWGAELREDGKVVWFELGGERADHLHEGADLAAPTPAHADADANGVRVELRDVPLLLMSAWLEHAGALLREHLLMAFEDDDPGTALAQHAAASEALALLEEQWTQLEQWPVADGHGSLDELLAGRVEPHVTAPALSLSVPRSQLAGFEVLDALLEDALGPADRGETLTAPTQPEVRALRRWLAREVRDQADGAAPRPLVIGPGDLVPTRAPIEWDPAEVTAATGACVAADDTDRIVAASPAALALLGHEPGDPGALVGRRLLAIIPARFHQAHLAGFTLHLVNGRGPLLGVPVRVPVVRRDGTELVVELTITARPLPHGRSVFVADLRHP